MNTISANELKTKGVSAIKNILTNESPEALITVRGQAEYVVLPIEIYQALRDMELMLALEEAKKEIASGQYETESVDEHMKRISQ